MLALAHTECQFPEDHVPTYQYACTECDHRFDAIQSFSDPSLTECPVCGGKLRKVFSSVGIVFKGSGFYRTDSRSGSGSAVAKAESGSDSSSSTTETKSDKSSEKKADTKAAPAAAKSSSPAAAAS